MARTEKAEDVGTVAAGALGLQVPASCPAADLAVGAELQVIRMCC
jgi:hypothetical protein